MKQFIINASLCALMLNVIPVGSTLASDRSGQENDVESIKKYNKASTQIIYIQEDIENLYSFVPNDKKDEPLRQLQDNLSKASGFLYQDNIKDASDIIFSVEGDVENLFILLKPEADSNLRDLQNKFIDLTGIIRNYKLSTEK